jgi:glycosyltransferase involved in cell wall biosynthesis
MKDAALPVVVEHSFGDPGSGGPITTLDRLLASRLTESYTLVRMHQAKAAGGLDLALIRHWVRLLRTTRPDLVHVRGLGNEGFHAVLAARIAGCPRIVLSIHGTARDLTAPRRRLRRAILANILEPISLRAATRIVTVCDAMQRRTFLDPVRDRLGPAIPNGVELPALPSTRTRGVLRAELGLRPDQIAHVSVGRLSVEKGHLELAAALAACDPGLLARVVLVLVGDGPDSAEIVAAYAAVPGLEVRALGHSADVDRVLGAADVFVLPTRHENLSNALLEAMAAGLPVIATAVGGNVEVLAGGGGILVPLGDTAALTAAISELAGDEALRGALGGRAREVVASSYSLDTMVTAWDACYRSVLRTTSSGAPAR